MLRKKLEPAKTSTCCMEAGDPTPGIPLFIPWGSDNDPDQYPRYFFY